MCELTEELYTKQDGYCFYCKRKMLPLLKDFVNYKPERTNKRYNVLMKDYQRDGLYPTYEHAIVVASDGGPRTIENGVCSCNLCNQVRGTTPHHEFMKIVENESDIINLFLRLGKGSLTDNKHNKQAADVSIDININVTINVPEPVSNTTKKFNYSVPHYGNIGLGLKHQQGCCYSCGAKLLVPKTVSQQHYSDAHNRPVYRRMLNNKPMVICIKCSRTPKIIIKLKSLN